MQRMYPYPVWLVIGAFWFPTLTMAQSSDSTPRESAPTPEQAVEVDLSVHAWSHRLLFVFSPEPEADAFQAQMRLWEGHGDGIRDRDLRLYSVVGSDAGRVRRTPTDDGRPITAASAQRLRERFDVETEGFTVILVGKDGTEKRRETEPVSMASIFDTIDAMPMRRAEMKRSEEES